MRFVIATEFDAVARLPGGAVPYTLRRSPRSRGLRVVIHPARGVVVTVPPASRRGWAHPEPLIADFLAEREAWLRRHLLSHARERAELAARGGLRDGAQIRFRGDLHRLRIEPAGPRARRSSVERIGGLFEDELVIRHASAGHAHDGNAPDRVPQAASAGRHRARDRPSRSGPRGHSCRASRFATSGRDGGAPRDRAGSPSRGALSSLHRRLSKRS